MKRNLAGKRILITGASSGIGRALAREAAQAGMRIVLAARSEDQLHELAGQLSSHAEVLALRSDVTSPADRERLIQESVQRFGGIDILVNNAGRGTQGLFVESDPDRLRQVMEVNFFAPVELIRLATPVLRQGEQPCIVNVSSMTGRRAMPLWTEYSASKFALAGFSESLRAEFTRYGIDVLLVCPGLTATNLDQNLLHHNDKMVIDFRRGMTPQYVARQILESIRKNRKEIVLGWEARWIVRANRFLPRLVDRLLARVVRRIYGPE